MVCNCTPSTRDRPFSPQQGTTLSWCCINTKDVVSALFLRLTAPEPMLQGTRDDWGAGAYRPHHKTLQERTVHKGTAWEFCETKVCTHNFKLELEEFSFIWVIFQPLAVLLGSLYPWTAECRTCTATTAQSPRLEVEGLWVDSIAVSVFVVILVEFDKYYQNDMVRRAGLSICGTS